MYSLFLFASSGYNSFRLTFSLQHNREKCRRGTKRIHCSIFSYSGYSLYGQKYWDTPFFNREKGTSKLWQQRWKHNSCIYKFYFHLCCNSFEVYEMTVPICTHMSWDLAFCRTVNFFHTDWIIISLWSLSYTQRHCHVRIEKGSVQTVGIKWEAHNSLEYHYMLKH